MRYLAIVFIFLSCSLFADTSTTGPATTMSIDFFNNTYLSIDEKDFVMMERILENSPVLESNATEFVLYSKSQEVVDATEALKKKLGLSKVELRLNLIHSPKNQKKYFNFDLLLHGANGDICVPKQLGSGAIMSPELTGIAIKAMYRLAEKKYNNCVSTRNEEEETEKLRVALKSREEFLQEERQDRINRLFDQYTQDERSGSSSSDQ